MGILASILISYAGGTWNLAITVYSQQSVKSLIHQEGQCMQQGRDAQQKKHPPEKSWLRAPQEAIEMHTSHPQHCSHRAASKMVRSIRKRLTICACEFYMACKPPAIAVCPGVDAPHCHHCHHLGLATASYHWSGCVLKTFEKIVMRVCKTGRADSADARRSKHLKVAVWLTVEAEPQQNISSATSFLLTLM